VAVNRVMKREYAAPLNSEIRLVIEKLDHHQKGVLLDGSDYWGDVAAADGGSFGRHKDLVRELVKKEISIGFLDVEVERREHELNLQA
jgi:hypothetical protein